MLNVSAPGGRVPLRSTVFWNSTQSFCHVMVQSLCSSTTAQNFSRATLFATWALEPPTPSHWLWVSSSLASHLIFFLAFTVAMFPSQACTGGGCTLSPPSQAYTEESSPENVPAPLATPLSPRAFNVSWTLPHTPNGEKTSTWAAVPRHRALKLQKKTMFRIHFKYTRIRKIFLYLWSRGFVWRRLSTRAWEIHQENKRKAGWGGQKKEN